MASRSLRNCYINPLSVIVLTSIRVNPADRKPCTNRTVLVVRYAFDSQQWQSMLLKFSNASDSLREAVAALTRRLANTLVPWEDIRALKAN